MKNDKKFNDNMNILPIQDDYVDHDSIDLIIDETKLHRYKSSKQKMNERENYIKTQ